MRFLSIFVLFLFFSTEGYSQKKLDRTLKKFNNESVPYVHVEELADLENAVLLDAREKEEYEVSHLKNAIWVGHKTFEIDSLLNTVPGKESEIVVYCSIGVRSENIGEKLIKAGYTNVRNLYGGIFEWKNKGFPVFDTTKQETEKVHAFSKHWGKLLTKGEKVYTAEKVMEY